jgi:hypothetical protein
MTDLIAAFISLILIGGLISPFVFAIYLYSKIK